MRIVLNEKTKPILLLFALSITALGIVWVVNQFKTTDTYYSVNTDTQTEYIIQDTTNTLENPDGVTPEEVVVEDLPTVLAAADGETQSCKEAVVKYKTESICTMQNAKGVDYEDGSFDPNAKYVSKNSAVVLKKVNMPLILISGSKWVPDSNREVTAKTPNVYKPAGEQFDEKIANNLLPPGSQISEKKPWSFKEVFSTFFSAMFGQREDKPTDEGELVIEDYVKNDCEECNNPSNVNPDKSNKIGSYMLDTSRYPGEKEKLKENSMDISQSCDIKTDNFVELKSTDYTGCKLGFWGEVTATIKTGMDSSRWNNCHVQYDEEGNVIPISEDCIAVENIIIKISSMFGSDKDCTDDTCTNAYMTKRNESVMPPKSATKSYTRTYFTTPCDAIIDGTTYEVKCAWDLDYLLKERKFNEFDDYVGNKTPSQEAYLQFLVEDSDKRKGETPIPM